MVTTELVWEKNTKCTCCGERKGYVLCNKGVKLYKCNSCPENCLTCDYNSNNCSLCNEYYGLVRDDVTSHPTWKCEKCRDENSMDCCSHHPRCSVYKEGQRLVKGSFWWNIFIFSLS